MLHFIHILISIAFIAYFFFIQLYLFISCVEIKLGFI